MQKEDKVCNITPANRVGSVQEYYFSKKLKEVAEMNAAGKNVINLGVGSPDLPPSEQTIETLCEHARKANEHGYQPYVGIPELRKGFADWYKTWYDVDLDPKTEIQPLIGSKEGILHISLAFLNSQQRLGNINEQIEISLENLQTEYVDCWLMHWPYPGYYIDTYHKMESVYNEGKIRAIGMANYHVRHFENLWKSGFDVAPHCVQFEFHPLRTAEDIVDFCKSHNISIQAYSPLCRMIPLIKDSKILKSISESHGKTIGQVILRWHYQKGIVPCFKSLKPTRLQENFSIWNFSLTDSEMKAIDSMNCGYKYHLESASCPGF